MSYKKTKEPGVNFQFYFNAALDEVGAVVKAAKGNLYTVIAENANATACYLQFFDAASLGAVTIGTTVPTWTVRLHGNSTIQLDRGEFPLRYFKTGIVVAATAGRTNNTAPAADPQVTLHFE